MTALAAWLDQYTGRAPAALGDRTKEYAFAAAPGASVAETLANGARDALACTLAQPSDRSAALDLLAADALVTLALLAQAETTPEGLGDFARALLRPERLPL